jgi:uridine phosphorylase
MNRINESELIINPDGSIYHLNLRPEHLADTGILVGDPARVDTIAAYLDTIEIRIANREFVTVTGYIGKKRISILATGMGADNIDIVLNELDALVNIDFNTRTIREKTVSLNLLRLGTSGALQADVEIDTFVAAVYGLGIDSLLRFYNTWDIIDEELSDSFVEQTRWPSLLTKPYAVRCCDQLLDVLAVDINKGITATACGFYGPQGRKLRLNPAIPDIRNRMQQFSYKGMRILNLEMETSALYGLSEALGHKPLTICAIIANRISQEYSKDYKKTIQRMIEEVLGKIQQV